MPFFRKKPVVIEAERTIRIAVRQPFHGSDISFREVGMDGGEVYDYLHDTWVKFEWGDWIIKGVKGEFYPCTDEVFWATYDEEP